VKNSIANFAWEHAAASAAEQCSPGSFHNYGFTSIRDIIHVQLRASSASEYDARLDLLVERQRAEVRRGSESRRSRYPLSLSDQLSRCCPVP